MVQGLVWPAGTGGVIGLTHSLEVFTKPTVQDYLTDFATGGRIPHPFSSDTKARDPACWRWWSEGALRGRICPPAAGACDVLHKLTCSSEQALQRDEDAVQPFVNTCSLQGLVSPPHPWCKAVAHCMKQEWQAGKTHTSSHKKGLATGSTDHHPAGCRL